MTSKHFNFRPSQMPVPARQCIPPSPPSLEATGRSHQTTQHRFFSMLAHFTFHLHAYLLKGEQTPRTSQINTGTFALQAELSISPTYWWNISSSRKLPDSEAAPAAKGSHCCVCTLTCNSQKSSFSFSAFLKYVYKEKQPSVPGLRETHAAAAPTRPVWHWQQQDVTHPRMLCAPARPPASTELLFPTFWQASVIFQSVLFSFLPHYFILRCSFSISD